MLGLIEGRIVHFVNANGRHMASIVVAVHDKDSGIVGLQVFDDCNSIKYIQCGYSADKELNAWHWIEQEVAPDPAVV